MQKILFLGMVDTPLVAVLNCNRHLPSARGDAFIPHQAALRAVFSKWFAVNAFN
jgi:hypothetical protein